MKKQVSEEQKLVKLIRGTARSLKLLADEIEKHGFDKDDEDLMSQIGSRILFEAKAFTFRRT